MNKKEKWIIFAITTFIFLLLIGVGIGASIYYNDWRCVAFTAMLVCVYLIFNIDIYVEMRNPKKDKKVDEQRENR